MKPYQQCQIFEFINIAKSIDISRIDSAAVQNLQLCSRWAISMRKSCEIPNCWFILSFLCLDAKKGTKKNQDKKTLPTAQS